MKSAKARREIRVVEPARLAATAAEELIAQAEDSLRHADTFAVALSGGNTPKQIYAHLAEHHRTRLPWDRVHFFWSDERHVPPADPQSNYRMASEYLLSQIDVPARNIHRIKAEYPEAGKAAAEYEREILAFFNLGEGAIPSFDLILLGMGPDGHTASLFPGTNALAEQRRLVVANPVEKLGTHRITFTYPLLNHGHRVVFVVGGPDKAAVLKTVLEGEPQPALYPAQGVCPGDGRLLWLVDTAAASAL